MLLVFRNNRCGIGCGARIVGVGESFRSVVDARRQCNGAVDRLISAARPESGAAWSGSSQHAGQYLK